MAVQVVLATGEDAEVIVDLIQELAAHGGDTSPLHAAYVATYLVFPGSQVLLARREGETVGLLSYSIRPNLYHAGPSCLIEELIVRGHARREGVGGALLEECLRRAQAAGCVEVSVTTTTDNARAIRFYRAHGMTDEAVLLEKHL